MLYSSRTLRHPFAMALTASRSAQVVSKARSASSVARLAAAPRSTRAVQVRAETATEAPKWTEPTLNPDTPSPIFGGSTGGLLRKAQVTDGVQSLPDIINTTYGALQLTHAVACAG